MDKGKIALFSTRKEVKDPKGTLVGVVSSTMAIRGIGGFGYKGNGST